MSGHRLVYATCTVDVVFALEDGVDKDDQHMINLFAAKALAEQMDDGNVIVEVDRAEVIKSVDQLEELGGKQWADEVPLCTNSDETVREWLDG